MDLRKLHLISSYVLLNMGSAALWLSESERIAPYPIVVAICSVVAYIFTDQKQLMQLPHFISNFLGLVILGTVFRELWTGSENMLLAMGHFLVYLQIVKFFRRKSPADFTMMYVLNLLQLCIGCIVTPRLLFGFAMFCYFGLALWTISLFQLCRPYLKANETTRVPMGAFLLNVLRLSLQIVPVALLVFWMIPRNTNARISAVAARTPVTTNLSTGFTESVSLDEETTVKENSDVAFRFRCFDRDGQPVAPSSNHLWRGGIYTSYLDRRWDKTPGRYISTYHERFDVKPATGIDRQYEIEFKDSIPGLVFSPYAMIWAQCDPSMGVLTEQETEGQLLFSEKIVSAVEEGAPFRYRVITGNKLPARRIDMKYSLLTQNDPGLLHPIIETKAKSLTVGLKEGDVRGKVQRILDYLNNGEEFSYTLELSAPKSDMDPIDYFLSVSKRGHCEYFASALALMLRSVDVSTRLVNGYKGWDYNESTGYYEVRQLHAHAWVEAYFPDEERWLSLDPSPAEAREKAVAIARSRWYGVSDIQESVSLFWNQFIVGYSGNSQGELAQSLRASLAGLVLRLKELPGGIVKSLTAENISSTSAAGQLIGVAVGMLVTLLILRGMVKWWRRRHVERSNRENVGHILPLYNDWLRLLHERGFVRGIQQTPREFASEVAKVLDKRGDSEHLFPLAMADLYCAVRYGNQEVTPSRLEDYKTRMERFQRSS